MFGVGAKGIAEVDMAIRRSELRLMTPLAGVWMHTHPFTARVVKPQYTDYGNSQKPRVVAAMKEFDTALKDREWLAGDSYSMGDIVLLTTIDFAGFVGLAMPPECTALLDWHARASARPSAAA